ncbi:MFS transporter [Kineococcus sp. SYSU DK002]|uniref:MFS transporter n=1 Tax=Kineococcus sp. SYSU DK002 TaxID=3383123 RepID=UPI003D7E9DD4
MNRPATPTPEPAPAPEAGIRLGLRENAAQFTLLVIVNALVGGMVGQQQTVLPLLAERDFGLSGYSFIFAYVAAFGITKAATNYLAGTLADRFGRKPVLVAGWLFAIPVPLLIIWAPSWGWVLVANVLLGVNQGLSWSTTVIMKIDLVGPARRGLAMGLNEAAGYGAVAITSLIAGNLAQSHGLRPAPFLLGLGYTVIALGLSMIFIRETREHARLEAASASPTLTPATSSSEEHSSSGARTTGGDRAVFADATWREPALASASQAGLVNNLNFGLSWGVFPLLFATADLSVAQIGLLVALYPAVWGAGQLATGWLSDLWGRKRFVSFGMLAQAAALAVIAASHGMAGWATGSVLLGLGTAAVYPALLAVVGDVAHPSWRARAVGVYRVWRDLGYAVGAVMGGLVADAAGLSVAVWVAAALSLLSALAVMTRMYETHQPTRPNSAGATA